MGARSNGLRNVGNRGVSKRDRPGKRARESSRPRRSESAQALFPRLDGPGGRYGVGVLLAIAEGSGSHCEIRFCRRETTSARPARRPRSRFLERLEPDRAARMLTGLAHADRIRIARAIMTGWNTHARLREELGLKVGPLYHHLRELERAGLLVHMPRKGYALTALGRDLLYVVCGLEVVGEAPGRSRAWRSVRRPLPAS